MGDRRACVACLLRQPRSRSQESLEMFFILRATRATDRWSGQVAFPGGHVDDGESDHQAVARECFEECGLSLDVPGAYRFIGCVADQLVRGGGSRLAVACRVYEQILPEPFLDLQVSEVAACGWVPLSLLLDADCAQPVSSTLQKAPAVWEGLPSVPLRMADLTLARGVDVQDARKGFVLWGLTLNIINCFLDVTGYATISLRSEGSSQVPTPRL